MASFFKTFFACLLAVFASGILFLLLGGIILAGMISLIGGSFAKSETIEPNSILRIDLRIPVVDHPSLSASQRFDYATFSVRKEFSLLDLTDAIARAAEDPRIDGICLEMPEILPTSLSILYEIRQALAQFRGSGKFVVSYADTYSQGGYYLASGGDRLYLNPQGFVEWRGLGSTTLFYKELLDKLGVEPILIRHGAFKSAGEPFLRTEMSDENRLQTSQMLASVWGWMVDQVAASRELSADTLQQYASRLELASASKALAAGMVDSLFYRDQFLAEMGRLTQRDEPRWVDAQNYKAGSGKGKSSNEIALVYASGEVVDQGDPQAEIVGRSMAELLADLREDDHVKGVVLRVNSPGGSALASDVIAREVRLLAEKKPIVVSMGDFAASGGYYIACGADELFASPATLTGSIGVFGLMFDVERGAKEKLGITSDRVGTNPSADIGITGLLWRNLTPLEHRYIQQGVDSIYNQFVRCVAQGREMEPARVEALAGGRVWAGVDARSNGLVDRLGTLRDAIGQVALNCGLEPNEYTLTTYPEYALSLADLVMDAWGGVRAGLKASRTTALERRLETEKQRLDRRLNQQGVRAELPFEITIE